MDLSYLFNALAVISFAVQVLVAYLLLRGPFRNFPLVLAYVLVQLATNIGELLAANFYPGGTRSNFYQVLYWTDEVVVDLLLFLVVIALTYKAMKGNPKRGAAGRLLAGVVIAVLLLPFILFPRPYFYPRWMNSTSQMLCFGGAILNFVLWTTLIGSRQRDPQLLMVSAGLGVAVTAAAISYGGRYLALPAGHVWLPNLFLSLTRVGSMLILWYAFRNPPKARPAPPAALATL